MTVCIIDDDLVSQFATRYCIDQASTKCRIIVCDHADMGLKLFSDHDAQEGTNIPDVLFLDLVMDGMDGWEFLDKLKHLAGWPLKTDIYILSAFTNTKDRTRAKEHPMVQGYFDKPLSKSNLDSIFPAKMA